MDDKNKNSEHIDQSSSDISNVPTPLGTHSLAINPLPVGPSSTNKVATSDATSSTTPDGITQASSPLSSTTNEPAEVDSYPDPIAFSVSTKVNESSPKPEVASPAAPTVSTFATNPWEASAAVTSPNLVEPTANPIVVPPVQFGPPKKSKKKFIVAGIVAGALVLLGGGSALAYNFWYQNPEKVVTDAIVNAFNAKTIVYTGTLDVSGDTKANIVVKGSGTADASKLDVTATFSFGTEEITLLGSALSDSDGNLYVKIGNVDKLIKFAYDFVPVSSKPLIDKLVAEINNKWIKISASDLEVYSGDTSKMQECFTDAQKKFQTDAGVRSEVTKLYQKNRFITIDAVLPSKDGSLGYLLKGDSEAAKSFAKGLKETSIYKSFHDCDENFTIDENDLVSAATTDSKDSTTTFELWVSQWSHQITKVHVQDKQPGGTVTKLDLIPVFNSKVTVTPPSESITLKQLQKDIEAIIDSLTSLYDDSSLQLIEAQAKTPTT